MPSHLVAIIQTKINIDIKRLEMNLNVLLPSLVTCFADLFCTVSPTPSISWYLPAKEICSDPPAPVLVDTLLPDFGFEILLIMTMVLV